MRLLLVTDSLLNNGAYSIQALGLAKRLQGDGHKVWVYGITYNGKPLTIDGITMFGNAGVIHDYGERLIANYAEQLQVDAIFSLKDAWIWNPGITSRLPKPWIAICPVDTEPLSSAVAQSVNGAAIVVAVSRNGQAAFQNEGISALYMPHGVNTDVFCPGDKAVARKQLGIPADKWVALFVGANQSRPSRKNLDQLLLAWDTFKDHREDVLLYLHTDVSQASGGIDVQFIAGHLRWTEQHYQVTDQHAYNTQRIDTEYMVNLYRAADVLVSIGSEGFGMPLLEAQACGCPVLANDFAAQAENIAPGGLIIPSKQGLPYGEHTFSNLGAFHFRPTQSVIATYLDAAYGKRGETERGQQAREWALKHSFDVVHENYWKPALREIENLLMGAKIEPERAAAD